MTRAELKQEAKNTLRGRWGKAIGILVIYALVMMGINMLGLVIPFFGSIAVLVISVPVSFGLIGQVLKFSRNEDVGYLDFFTIGFDNFGKAWGIFGRTLLKLLPYIIAYILCTIAIMIAVVWFAFSATASIFGAIGANSTQLDRLQDLFNSGITGILIAMIIVCIMGIISIGMVVKSLLYVLTDYIGNDNTNMSAKEIVEKSEQLMKGNRWRFFVLNLSFIGWAILSAFTFGIGYLWLLPYMEVTFIKFYEDLIQRNNNSENVSIINN